MKIDPISNMDSWIVRIDSFFFSIHPCTSVIAESLKVLSQLGWSSSKKLWCVWYILSGVKAPVQI